MAKIILVLIFMINTGFSSELDRSHLARTNYAQRMYNSFLIQSIGETRTAYYCFKSAFQDAQKAGVNPKKLALMNDLFIWYRKFGWSCGFMTRPAHCTGECTAAYPVATLNQIEEENTIQPQVNYLSEWAKSPQGGKHIRNFMLGVAELGAVVFGLSLQTPFGFALAGFAGQDSFSRCFNSLNEGYADYQEFYQERIRELKIFEKKAHQYAQDSSVP